MKYLVLLVLILVGVGCKETTSQFATLDPIDQEYLRNLGASQCRTKFAQTFLNYKTSSETTWDLTSGYKRGSGFHQEFLEGTAVASKVDIKVWKVDATDIYFYVTETISSTEDSYFLKLSRVQNDEIIDDLAEDFCIKKYTSSGTGTSGPLTLTEEFTRTNSTNANNTDHYKDVYTLNFNRPAYLGPYSVTRTITTTDRSGSGGTVIGTAKSFKTTYVAQSYTFATGALYNSMNVTVTPNVLYYVQKFCVPAETTAEVDANGAPVFRLYKFPANSDTTSTPSTIYRFGYNYSCTLTTIPVGWDLTY